MVYIPTEQKFAILSLTSATGRNSSEPMIENLRNRTPVDCTSKEIKNKDFEWQAPVFSASNTPFKATEEETALATEALNIFLNAKDRLPETDSADER